MLAMLTYVACSDDPVAIPVEEEASFEEKLQQIKAIAEDGITADEQEEINEILSTVGYAEMEGHMETNHNVVETEEIGDVPFAVIEEVPVFPGCEGLATNEERKACMSQKVTEFINLNFNTSLGRELGLKGINRIYVQFRINDDGTVEVLGARAPHPDLQEEAERVVNLLPQMTPGKQKGQEVGVLYSLPISFKVSE